MQDLVMSELPQPLTAYVVCKDARGQKLAHLLTDQFSEVYWLASDSDCSRFLEGETEGLALPSRSAPNRVNAIFFHSSDERLLKSAGMKADFVFEFNSPGTPLEKPGITRILRQTAPYFAIRVEDVREVAQYIQGQRQMLPIMCYRPLEAIPALWLLCQSFVAAAQNEKVYVCQPQWWLQGLGIRADSDRVTLDIEDFHKKLRQEWPQGQDSQASLQPVNRLIESCLPLDLSKSPKKPSGKSIDSMVVDDAHQAIAKQFKYPIQTAQSEFNLAYSYQAILFIQQDRLAATTATVIGFLQNIPALPWEPGDSRKIPPDILLVVTKAAIVNVPQLRLNGFRGPVLVVASEPFSVLKQQHRVLRFGQGAHTTFGPPWSLANLPEILNPLIPLEPENLALLQAELREAKKTYQESLLPCLERLQLPGRPLPEDMEQLQTLIGKLRVRTPFVCHEIVTISGETAQLQQHLEQAVAELQPVDELNYKNSYSQGLQRLTEAFTVWHAKVSASGEVFSFAG
jgi:hypothetical protein